MTYERNDCRMCHGALKLQMALTPTPIANSFPREPFSGEFIPLELMQCVDCSHVQLRHVPSDEAVYVDYKYATPDAAMPYLERYAKSLRRQYPKARRTLEIGCNNGLFLDALKKSGFEPLGIDPATTHKNAIPVCFTAKLAERLCKFDLIVANNVFAHIDDLDSVFDGISACLSDNGALVIEAQYMPSLMVGGMFDMVYHEHRDYHTVGPWATLLKRYGLYPMHVEFTDVHGGAMRLHCGRHEIAALSPDEPLDWSGFEHRIERGRERALAHLENAGKIALFGAPAKATTLLHHYGITDRFAYCVDNTPAKQGRYIPGTGIKILPESALKDDPPDLLFLAAWNYYDVIHARYPQYRIANPFMQSTQAKEAA